MLFAKVLFWCAETVGLPLGLGWAAIALMVWFGLVPRDRLEEE